MHKLGRKLGIWTTAVVALATACCLPYATFAAGIGTDVITVPSTAHLLKEAAEIQLIVNTFQKCVGTDQIDEVSFRGTPNTPQFILSSDIAASNMFGRNINNAKPVGAWLEYEIQDKVNNGTIWCSDEDSAIVRVFAEKLGFSKEQIACNIYAGDGYEAGQRGGLFKRLVKGEPNGNNYHGVVGYNYHVVNDCIGGLSDPNAHYTWSDDGWNEDTDSGGTAKYIGGKGYIEFLYNQYRNEHLAENPYLVAWDDLGNFTNPVRGYYLYLDDFYTSCGSDVVNPATTDSDKRWPAISIIDANYGIVDTVYSKKTGMHNDWGSSFVSKDTPHTCETVAGRINELAPSVQSLLQNAKKNTCNMQSRPIALKKQQEALEILNNPEMDDESKAVAQDVYDRIEAMEDFGTYWTNTSEGGIVCMEIPSVTGATTIVDEDPAPPTPSPGPEGEVGVTDGCFNSSGALGWIICPVIKIIGEAVNGTYGIVEKNYLSMGSDIMQRSQLSSAWNIFQNFANIVFAILFLIVIFAQVTGFGISNYGVKKVLPRLIITAILVNLSLIICTMAADLSNIVGASLNETLRNIEVETLKWSDINIGTFLMNTITGIGTVGTPLAIAGAAITITIMDGGWSVLIMPLLIGAIIAFFAVLFFYVLLAVRKAAIVLLIAISPVAVICYALPNTQNIFRRWLKMLNTLLLVYPICGLLMGGGNLASRLLLVTAGDAGFVYYLVCMLLSVVPFFFIPTLLKNSMSVLGSIGAKISNMGSRWSNMATGALRRSRWAQDHQQEVARNIDMNRSKRIQARNQKVLDRLNKKRTNPNDARDLSGLSSRERRQYTQATLRNARATATLSRRHNEEVEAANVAEYYTDEMLQNQEASARKRYRDSTVASFADGTISNGKYHRSDGSTEAVDIDSPDSIEAALVNLAQDVENNPDDKLAQIRLEAMMEVAKRKGAKGRRSMINALRATQTQGLANAAKSMARAISLDDKTMGALHSYDAGSEKYVQDIVAGNPIESRAHYAEKTIESLKLDNIGDMDDTFWDNLKELHTEINGLSNSSTPLTTAQSTRLKELEQSYKKAVDIMTQAASDPRYAGKIKSKDARDIINTHAKQMYEIERTKWLNDATNLPQLSVTDASGATMQATSVDNQGYLMNGTSRLLDASGNAVKAQDAYSSQIKAYHDVALGQGNPAELKVLRKRAMPAGVKIDPSTNRYRMEVAPANGTGGTPSFRDLTPDEQRLVDKIIDYNASVDIQNQG